MVLSSGAIAGIVVGCVVALVVCIAFFCGLIIVTFVAARFIYQQIYHGPFSYRRNRSKRDSGKGLLAKESLLQEENEEPTSHSIDISQHESEKSTSPIFSQPPTYQSTNSSKTSPARRTSVTKTIVPKDEPLILDPVEKELFEWKKQKMQNVHLLSEEIILDEVETVYNDDGTLKATSYVGVMSLLLQHVLKFGIKVHAHSYKSSSAREFVNTPRQEHTNSSNEEANEDLLELFFATYSSSMSSYDLWKYIMYFLKQDEKANRDACFKLIEYWISYYFEDVTDEVKLQLVNFFDQRQDCHQLRKLLHMKIFPSKYGLDDRRAYPLAFEFKEMLKQLKIELKIEEEEEEEEEENAEEEEEEDREEDGQRSPKPKKITMENATPEQIAEQYTLLQQRYMRKVTVRELNAGRYMQNRMTKEAPCVNRLILNFNRLGSYFAAKILEKNELPQRVAQIEIIVQIIQHLANINNYDTMMALHCCLDSSAIHRLSKTMSELPENVTEVLAMLDELFDNSKRFYNLRVTIANTKAECCLPYFGLFLSTLNQIDAANKEFIKSETTGQKLINFNKKRVYLKILKQFQSYQSVLSLYEKQIQPIPSLQKSIEESILFNDTLPTDEQLYQLSQNIRDE